VEAEIHRNENVRQTKAFGNGRDTRLFLRLQSGSELRKLLFCVLGAVVVKRVLRRYGKRTTSPNLMMAALSFWSGGS
jgi:hypothetical protein